MEIYFSPTLLGFYLGKLKPKYTKAKSWPADAVLMTEAEVTTYWNQSPPEGKQFGVIDGRPSWVDITYSYKELKRREREWRDDELAKVLNRIDQYEKDQSYPENLRTSPINTHDDFILLLNDRKVLSDYPDAANFPNGERPLLSGLAY